ncbi:hypothetical protein F4806DRAFT_480795 [Annulohypoxylon nitens]|nr:hypothetical protein F4806DRAFT_480795 [Annulohypoxylon nitens]
MPLQIPHPNTPLHLYRHLLREATYLPSLCRPWVTSRIKARYRDCQYKKGEDAKRYIKDAHHHLRNFRSANDGNVKRILRLCYMATGRSGKRRRLLGKSELSSEPPTSSAELDEKTILSNINNEQQFNDWINNWDMAKVKAIAQSQADRSDKDLPFHMCRVVDPKKVIPAENSFGRPLSKKLARNKTKKHWVQVLRQLLPPLPQGEWDQLGVLSRGEADPQHYKLATRRPLAQQIAPVDPNPDDKLPFWANLVNKPMRKIERPNSRKMKSLSGGEDEDPRGHGRKIGIRLLNQRKFRRSVYLKVWQASPIVEKNARSGNWNVTWGNHQTNVSRPRSQDLQFFQGVNERGLPMKPTPQRKATAT